MAAGDAFVLGGFLGNPKTVEKFRRSLTLGLYRFAGEMDTPNIHSTKFQTFRFSFILAKLLETDH